MREIISSTFGKALDILVLLLVAVLPLSRGASNIFAGLVILTFAAKVICDHNAKWFSRLEFIPFWVFTVVAGSATILSINFHQSIGAFMSPTFKYIAIFFAVAYSVNTEQQISRLSKMFLLTGVVAASYGIYQHQFLGVTRISSTLSNPNGAGSYFAMLIAVNVSLLLTTKKWANKVSLLLSTVVASAAAYYTMSRGAFLGLGGAFAVLITLSAKFSDKKKMLSVVVLTVVLATVVLGGPIKERFVEAANYNNESNRQRIYMLESGWKMFLESPLIGKGPGSFEILWNNYKPEDAEYFRHPHNIYLLILIEMGLVGLIAYLGILFVVVRSGLAIILIKIHDKKWGMVLGGLLSIIILTIHGFVDATLKDVQVGLVVCIFAGLFFSLYEGNRNTANCISRIE